MELNDLHGDIFTKLYATCFFFGNINKLAYETLSFCEWVTSSLWRIIFSYIGWWFRGEHNQKDVVEPQVPQGNKIYKETHLLNIKEWSALMDSQSIKNP